MLLNISGIKMFCGSWNLLECTEDWNSRRLILSGMCAYINFITNVDTDNLES